MCMHNIDVRRVYFLDILRHVPMFVSQVGRIRWEGIFHQVQPPASLANNSIYIYIYSACCDLICVIRTKLTKRTESVLYH